MSILALDHLVLTVADPEASAAFYARTLGLEPRVSTNGRVSLCFGRQKINLHPADAPFAPHAREPRPGSADLCLIADEDLEALAARLDAMGVELTAGPVEREGALGPMRSIYFRDPDGNLLEICNYDSKEPA